MDFRLVRVLFCLSFALSSVHSYDDLLIAVEDRLELLAQGASKRVPLAGFNASKLSVLAYDSSSEKLFFSDRRHSRGHIFSTDINSEGQTGPVKDLVERNTNESVEGMSYDPVDKTLIWTDGLKQSIRRLKVGVSEESNSVELVHFLENDRPSGVVVDPCSRMLYWTNRNMEHPTIERSYLNGSNREIIVQKDLLIPQGLGIDVQGKKLYWANNLRMGYFHIERSNFDGSNRELIYRGIGQFVFSLTVGRNYIYWSDWDRKTVWALAKDGAFDEPVALRHYQSKPMAVVVFQHHVMKCDATEDSDDEPAIDDNLCAGFCYNNGECVFLDNDYKCRCPAPFTGERCDQVETAHEKPQTTWRCPDTNDNGALSEKEAIVLMVGCIVCAILLATVVILSIRLSKSIISRRRRRCASPIVRRSSCESASVVDIENCCQTISLCEGPCLQQPNVDPAGKGTASKWSSDKAKLLAH